MLYRVFWAEYCDWYVEATKAVFQATDAAQKANTLAVMDFVLSHLLRLFHPFPPFITEELWHGLGYAADMPEDQGGRTVMFAPWPKPLGDDFKRHYGIDESDEKVVDAKYDLIGRGRNLRREFNIPSSKKVRFILKPKNPWPQPEQDSLRALLNADPLEMDPYFSPKQGTPIVHSPLGERAAAGAAPAAGAEAAATIGAPVLSCATGAIRAATAASLMSAAPALLPTTPCITVWITKIRPAVTANIKRAKPKWVHVR